ncbi:hypothetical protein [Rhodoplanes serenus]|uniref:hypothetical protein n=1 Tax=Rhodoplanes serenus TaxID=200615 RepID=UPI000DAD8676|nr:hypothetical protein [Rhodoplanes serenus]RAI35061.1 hypothetical protein CH340_07065 [Rhodoplanes serenus]
MLHLRRPVRSRSTHHGRAGAFLRVALVAAATNTFAASAGAHQNEELAGIRGDHGGMLRAAGAYHLELVLSDGELRVWVTDHDMVAQPTAGASGSATVLAGAEKIVVKLTPDGSNGLVGKNPGLRNGRDVRVILHLAMPGTSLQTNFVMNRH